MIAVPHAPEPVRLGRWARSTAAALALGAMVGAGGEATAKHPGTAGVPAAPTIAVRQVPPEAPVRHVFCNVTSMRVPKKGPLVVHASCPQVLYLNAWGQLLDGKNKPIKSDIVVVKKVKGKTVEAHAQTLKTRVKAKKIRFSL